MTDATKALFAADHIIRYLGDRIVYPKVDRDTLRWGWRLNQVDLSSSHGYYWPAPGKWAKAPGPILDHAGDCCQEVGDGICAALTISGAQSAGARFSHHVGVLVAWTDADVLGASSVKVRLRRAWVAALFDPIAAARADLSCANLSCANLGDADLGGANLGGANLGGANLSSANLSSADLWGANLSSANLGYADLRYANLRGADLGGADLRGANLSCANLGGANLGGANLGYADLRGADLGDANLSCASYSQLTLWPAGFDPQAAGARKAQ